MISARFEPHPIAHAYTKGRSIITNARQHVGKEWLLHIDLLNFFGWIREEVVRDALRRVLSDFSNDEVRLIAGLCCYRGSLPQGSPSSPALSNLVCLPLDDRLLEFANSLGLAVTRYSDDICFSSRNPFVSDDLATVRGRGARQHIELGARLSSLFDQHGFKVNVGKLRFQKRSDRQLVTGLVVNDTVNVPIEYYRRVRAALRLWEQCGIAAAACQFRPELSVGRFAEALRGQIDYIGQVTGRSGQRYRDFRLAFERLVARDIPSAHPV